MISYLEHFHSFIQQKLPMFNDTFTLKEMIDWIRRREPQRKPQNIRDHLLKRTVNYEERNKFVPPPTSADDLFFSIEPNLFRRYQTGVDPKVSPSNWAAFGRSNWAFGRSADESVGTRRKASRSAAGSRSTTDLLTRFTATVAELDSALSGRSLEDAIVSTTVRAWLDGDDKPLPWTKSQGLTDDEWFFITTLYGTMSAEGQRTHIRKFFPTLFVNAAKRDMRNFSQGMPEFEGLRSPWMSQRLSRMGEILRERRITMNEYVANLRFMQETATPYNPTPALDAIALDHRATARKTLSVFIRDCVQCNCFSIDSRVSKQLAKYGLPEDERLLVSLSLEIGRNPRQVARMFYELG